MHAEARGQPWSPLVALHLSSTEPGTHRLSCTDTGEPLSSRDLPRPAPPVLGLRAAPPHLALPNEPSPHFLSTYFLGYFSLHGFIAKANLPSYPEILCICSSPLNKIERTWHEHIQI